MAYIFKEELEDGDIPADVVERESYDTVINERDELMTERDTLITQRDAAIGRAETAEANYKAAQNKYADAFLSSPERAKREQREDVTDDGKIQTFEELWGQRGKFYAY